MACPVILFVKGLKSSIMPKKNEKQQKQKRKARMECDAKQISKKVEAVKIPPLKISDVSPIRTRPQTREATMCHKTRAAPISTKVETVKIPGMKILDVSPIRTQSQTRKVSVCRITRAASILNTPRTSKLTRTIADVKESARKLLEKRPKTLEETAKYQEEDTMISTQAKPSKISSKEIANAGKSTDDSGDHHSAAGFSDHTVRKSRSRMVMRSSNSDNNEICPLLNTAIHKHEYVRAAMKSKKSSTTQVATKFPATSVNMSGPDERRCAHKVTWHKPISSHKLIEKNGASDKFSNSHSSSTTARKGSQENKSQEMIKDLRTFLNNVGLLLGMMMLFLSLSIMFQKCS